MSGSFGNQLKDVFQLVRASPWTLITDGNLREFTVWMCLLGLSS